MEIKKLKSLSSYNIGGRLQCTNSVLMVYPDSFGFNIETAKDNEFQHDINLPNNIIRSNVINEFNSYVDLLRLHGINVIVFKREDYPESYKIGDLNDAIFPNNWISFHNNGEIYLYLMKVKNRQNELKQWPYIKDLLEKNHFNTDYIKNNSLINIKNWINELNLNLNLNIALEGTGSLIFDHINRCIYAAISERCDLFLLKEYGKRRQYEIISFETKSSNNKSIYHTNVLLSIGENFAVICSECIKDEEKRLYTLNHLKRYKKDVIEINLQQMEQGFCGNILQLKNFQNQNIIIMSDRAKEHFHKNQLDILSKHGKILSTNLDLIERIGGGSARCMLAEIFLPFHDEEKKWYELKIKGFPLYILICIIFIPLFAIYIFFKKIQYL